MAASDSVKIYNQAFLDGQWRDAESGKTFSVSNPATGAVIAQVSDMSIKETEEAIQAAHKAFQMWKHTSPKERCALLRKWHELILERQRELATVLTAENGKPFKESIGEITYGADHIELFAEEAKRINGEVVSQSNKSKQALLVRQPIGVIGMITPWNFPNAMITRKAGAALAAGCTVVIKPAEDTPLSALQLVALAHEAGIPRGVINVLPCSRSNAAAVGQTLCGSPLVAGISFTGSTAVGKLLYAQCAPGVKRVALELGGNAPVIVFESADLNKAVAASMLCKFRNAGQTCICANRIYVHSSIYDEYIKKYKAQIQGLKVGNGADPETTLGPLINEAQFKKVSALVKDAVDKGATVHVGGGPHASGGLYFEPTLLTDVTAQMEIAATEIFGPVAVVYRFESEAEVVKAANDTRYGLAGYFFSEDLSQIWRVARELEYGMVGINDGMISCAEAAFGGIKESGIGREGSKHGIDEFTYIKYLCFGGLEY